MASSPPSGTQADTRLLYIVHRTFRLMTDRFVDATETQTPQSLRPMIESRWSFYTGVLHHHHRTEDDSVFPALITIRPDLEVLIKSLAEDHRQLADAIETASNAVVAFAQEPDVAHQRAMHQAVDAVREGFFPHLDVEDAHVLPAITESMCPDLWARLDRQALTSIPKRYLPLAVGALDEVIRSLPEEQQPPPPPPPIRLMLTLSWRKKWTTWVKPLLN